MTPVRSRRHLPLAVGVVWLALALAATSVSACSDAASDASGRSTSSDDDDSSDDDSRGDDDALPTTTATATSKPPVQFDAGGPRLIDGGDPWADVAALAGQDLRTALYERIKGHTSLGYDGARDALLGRGDIDGVGGKIECVYTGRLVIPDGTRVPDNFNTEHSWPQSQGAESEPARSDLHHLFAVDEKANNARASFPFGNVTCLHGGATACGFQVGGSALGQLPAGGSAFEVRAAKRGDIARAHFYFSVRYQLPIGPDEEAALRAWSAEDVVDAWEAARNDAIDAKQHNRNPFIDHPDFVAKIADY